MPIAPHNVHLAGQKLDPALFLQRKLHNAGYTESPPSQGIPDPSNIVVCHKERKKK
jgi:hypothetical protein